MVQTIQLQPSIRVQMEYQDVDGVVTNRTVQLNEVEYSDREHLYLHGFCELRNEQRTFRAGRVRSISRTGGSPLSVVEFLRLEKLVDFGSSQEMPSHYDEMLAEFRAARAVSDAEGHKQKSGTNVAVTFFILMLAAIPTAWVIAQFGWVWLVVALAVLGIISLLK
ncbi:MAG: WYL domain-containing protein [Salipiger marinus]|uniref:WYL domain-containing protein n=1 Tax=Salipiger marinus TaxID=555512 RepID=UPI004059FF4F